MKKARLGIGLAVLALLASKSLATTVVEYQGSIKRFVVGPAGTEVGTPSQYTFAVAISGERYRISRVSLAGVSCFDEVVGSDGMDSYLLQKQWPTWKDKEANSSYREVGHVTPGLFPSLASPESQLLWIVLSSQKTITNGQSLCLSHISYAPYEELKAKVVYAASGDWIEELQMNSPGVELTPERRYPLPPPFDEGYKLWDVKTRSTAQDATRTYPKEVCFSQYSVFVDQKAFARKILEIQITVTNCETRSAFQDGDFLPNVLSTNTMVNDFRFSQNIPRPNSGKVDALQYKLAHLKWRDRTDAKVASGGASILFERQLASSASTVNRTGRYVVVGILVATSVAFLLFFSRWRLTN